MASTYLTKTSPTAGNRTKGTISVWVKRGSLSGTQWIYDEYYNGNNFSGVRFNSTNKLGVFAYDGGSAQIDVNTTRVFRDTNAWYHIVVAWDTTQGTASDRVKIYINGVRETVFDGSPTYPSSSASLSFGSGGLYPIEIGRRPSTEYFDGSMSHFHRVDNQQLAQTVFGSTDSTTGEWKINPSPSITYTGSSDFNFFILKDTNSGTDQSGQSNNLTVGGGTLTKTEECPSNVFATLNPLVLIGSVSFTAGNTKFSKTTGTYWRSGFSTLGMTTGKYYFEVLSNAGANNFVGARDVQTCDGSLAGNNDFIANVAAGYGLYSSDGKVKGNSNSDLTGVIGTFTDSDYIGCFLDLDNNKLYFSKNGTMLNTTGVDIASGKTYLFGVSGYDSNSRLSCNFGNGAFDNSQLTGTTYNGSDGNGIFKYNPNNITLDGSSKSFKSLSTKGLNT